MSLLKRVCRFCLILLLMLSLSGCVPKRVDRNFPLNFIGSTWRTEGGEMQFTVNEDHFAVGTIATDNGEIEVVFSMSPTGHMPVYPIERIDKTLSDEEQGNIRYLEWWHAGYDSTHSFGVYVDESTYFEHGDKFTFYRVDDGDLSETGK